MENFYLLLTEQRDEKYISYVVRYYQSYNLISVLKKYPYAVAVNIYKSKTRAESIAEEYNAIYKQNGTYLFD